MKLKTAAAVAILTMALTAILSGLTGLTASSATAAGSSTGSWGAVSAPKQTIKDGCKNYSFTYAVKAPGSSWLAEFRLVNPNGRQVSTRSYESSTAPAKGKGSFQLCKATTIAGRYKILMKVTSYDDRDATSRKVDPGKLRLVERR